MRKIGWILLAVVVALLALAYYLIMPPLTLGMLGGVLFIGIGIVLLSCPIALIITDDEDVLLGAPMVTFVIIFIIVLIGLFFSSAIIHSNTMYRQIGEMDQRSFKDDVLEIDTSQIPTVDIELAMRVADKKLGEEVALGSQVEIGEFTNKQQVDGKLVYVAPLEHRGFFKWLSNQWGTPGYVIVSATNPNDVKLVRELNGNSIKLKYMHNAFFGSDLTRHLRSSGFRTTGLTEYSFELDDEGYPYWVVTTYENTTLWTNPEATGVIICDPQTGECTWYSVENAPNWIDIIQPESFIVNQLQHYGTYVHGWWNPSERDKLTVTPHMVTVYNNNECFYYTGMSSSGADEGTVGFVLVNTRNKRIVYYKMVGATEAAAMRSAEGKVQDMGYTASEPIPLNISGIPAYFCTLKDSEGLIKAYAMLKIEDYSVVATGTTIMETKRAFINVVNSSGARVDFGDGNNVYGYELEGIVSRIGSNIESGETYYYMIINDEQDKLYLASYTVSEELPVTREGDKVRISYIDESNGVISIITFDNIQFAQELSPAQEKINEEQKEDNIINSSETTVTTVDPETQEQQWENLSDEEKAKLLEQLNKE